MALVDKLGKRIIYTREEREVLKGFPIDVDSLPFTTRQYLDDHPEKMMEIRIHNETYAELSQRQIDWKAVGKNALCDIGSYAVSLLLFPLAVAGAMGGGTRVIPDAFDKYKQRNYNYKEK